MILQASIDTLLTREAVHIAWSALIVLTAEIVRCWWSWRCDWWSWSCRGSRSSWRGWSRWRSWIENAGYALIEMLSYLLLCKDFCSCEEHE
jgi:hypothetical protein